MQRDRAFLLDILEAARLAVSYVEDVAEEDFLRNTQLQDSVIRRIEIMGEAARRISPNTQSLFPMLPWSSMIGMRNLLIHDYDGIDLQIVWQTVQQDLPSLISQLETAIPPEL